MSLQPGGAHSQPSLPSLPAHLQSDTHLTAHLASRFHINLPTAQLSSHALVSLNTYTDVTKGPNGGEEGSAKAGAKDMANRAYLRLGARSENQAVVFLGESGSGKTAIRAEVVAALLSKSASPLSQKLSHATFLFDSLTTTKTTTSPSASKAGLFFELQYETADRTNPNLIGGKLLDHRLERSRIASVPTGERNFHILYYLLAGTSAAEKKHLGLDENHGLQETQSKGPKRWRYLGHQSQLKAGIDDAGAFQLFKNSLRKLEFPRQNIAEICQVLAAILHIGQLEFETADDTTPTGDESGGYSHEGANTVTVVKNKETLAIIAAFLCVGAQELQTTFGYKTKMLNKERVTLMLDPAGAKDNADELARTLYSLLVAYIVEQCNQRICVAEDAVSNTISIVDFPGFVQQTSTSSHLDQLFNNAATEMLYNFTLKNFFEKKAELLDSEEVVVPVTSYFDNSPTVTGLLKHNNGLLSILDDQTRKHRTDQQLLETLRKRFEGKNPAISVSSGVSKLPGSNFATYNSAASFTVKHFAGEVDYPVTGLIEANGEIISGDLMNLINNTKSAFIGQLFGQEALQTVVHPQEKTTIMQAQVSSKPMRKPSVMRKGRSPKLSMKFGDENLNNSDELSDTGTQATKKTATNDVQQGAAAQFLTSIDNVRKSLMGSNANCYFVFCLKPNDRRIANQFDSKCVRTQLQTFGIAEISQRLRAADFSVFLPFGEFVGLAESEQILVGSEREKVEMVVDAKRWPANEATIGSTGIFLSERCWMSISNLGEGLGGHYAVPSDDGGDSLTPGGFNNGFGDSIERLQIPGRAGGVGYFGAVGAKSEADASEFGRGGDMFKNMETREEMAEKGNQKQMVEVEEIKTSASRKRWVFFVYLLTWPIPDFLIKWIGRMKRKDVRVAWREKFAINMLIWFSCLFVIFFIVVFPMLICPKQHVYSAAELSAFNGKKGSRGAYVAIRGQVFDLEKFAPAHQPSVVSKSSIMNYAGKDATALFPVQVSALCEGKLGYVDSTVPLDYTTTNQTGQATLIEKDDINAKYHDFRHWTNDSRPDWFYQQMVLLRSNYKKGNVGYPPTYIKSLAEKQQPIAILNNRVYDFQTYMRGGRTPKAPNGDEVDPDVDVNFMDQKVVDLFTYHAGNDLTKEWDILDIDPGMRQRMQMCLDNLFYVGDLDTRNSVQCQFAAYLVLVISIILCSVIVFKFFAALQFGTKNIPEHLDKFIMCQVPAYTEDEESLRRAIDSAARMKYDDKRKLLVIICDGMIIGQGNDKPTPRIVLDILGVNETVDPEPLSFESLGEGAKQHNMGKVYSGLYEVQGHIVPFLVVVKIGKPSEVSRPGNRGKRDSQMIMMRFLNRVHYNAPMSPLELEMYHQIRNIIGVNPTFYEFMLQIDADTVVAPDAASRMVSAFLDDTRLIGVCGETALANSKSSLITMIQVYEYYISHNLSKAFESLFGSVTCLPGCFTMYRVRAADSGKPLFVSKDVCDAYANIRVDTLHMKNLLHLGEDRYLTTLLLKYHSKYKTKYIFDAHAWTIAPDDWKIFLSQRRRWINSTVHNLLELAPMNELCGFCCFSMRFVVFIDLLSTIVQPVTLAYIVYLVYTCVTNPTTIPITAFILLGAIYGLQAFIFIVRRKWEMIGWMILYILAIPVFTFALPLYSFWHMDDFSWGNTRVVTGEAGRKVVITDEGKFDPASVPKKKWEEYQAELWEGQEYNHDAMTEVSGYSYATKSYGQNMYAPQSESGMPPSRPMSSMTGLGGSGNPFGDSRTSIAMATPMQERPQSMFNMGQEVQMMDLQALPTDDALLAEIREILATSDLMTVSKKSVKLELERRFGVPLDGKRAYINASTEALLSAQL